ncbi:acyl carrier protein [Streptomyces sp. NPDC001339]|uniref:acyl carrier protein n=1 Tax=Streptomyces sp. NPDC001339 TaxID=3364563 RepID=UPI0036A37AA5
MNAAEVVNALPAQRFGAPSGDVTDETPLRGPRTGSLALEELRVLMEDRGDIDHGPEDVPLTAGDTVGRLVAAVDGPVPA